MYGIELSSLTLPALLTEVYELNFRSADTQKTIRKQTKKLSDQNRRFFRWLGEGISPDSREDDNDRYTAVMNSEAIHHLKNIKKISEELMNELAANQPLGKGVGKRDHILSSPSSALRHSL